MTSDKLMAEEPTVEGLTLEEKVGQMVMMGISGTNIGPEATALIERYRVGGIMLFAENVESPAQIAELTDGLQRLALGSGPRLPLLISIDQEGGRIVRIRDGVTPLPSHMAIGATGSAVFAEQIGRIVGHELAAMGINMNAAPVMDVNSNPLNPVIGIRSFGEDPGLVADLGTAFIRGMQASGLLATAKHFPGHGDTEIDSHLALPTIAHPRARLAKVELVPFRTAIAAGVDAIMSAHITFPAVDDTPGLPSTLSHRVLTGLLRREMGFDGIIVTDALEMEGITARYPIEQAAVMAVQAGADIVLIAQSQYYMDGLRALEQIAQAVRDGTIPMQRIDESVRRILAAKLSAQRKEAVGRVSSDGMRHLRRPPMDVLAHRRSMDVVRDVARHAVTVVRDTNGLLPMKPDMVGTVLVIRPDLEHFVLADELRKRLPRVKEEIVSLQPGETDIHTVLQAANGADTIVVATAGAVVRPGQAQLVRAVHASERNVIVLAVSEPYDLASFPSVSTYVASYGWQPLHVRAAVEVLFGEQPARGRLPVSIPKLYPVGHGIYRP